MILRFHFHFKVFSENRERAEWEGDAPARREREREREREEEPRKPKRARLRLSSPTASHPKTDHPRPRSSSLTASLDRPRPRSSSPIAISPSRRLRSQHWLASHDFASCRTQSRPDYEFFFSRFYLCFWIEEWNYIFVWQLRKCEKMWVISRKCVFYGIFNNTTKHQKIFFTTFSEMQQNTLKIFSFPENNISGK